MRVRARNVSGCFGCDPGNAAGLGIRFSRDAGGRLTATCRPGAAHGGLGRIVNAGLVATLGEELAAAEAATHGDEGLVVSRVEVSYERPAYVESELVAVAVNSTRDGRTVTVSVDIMHADERIAALVGTFVLVSADKLLQMAGITLEQAPACLVAGREGETIADPSTDA